MAYHFNWGREAVLGMPHHERQRWCEEISAINERINEESAAAGGPGPSDPGTTSGPTLEQEITDEFFEEDEDASWLE